MALGATHFGWRQDVANLVARVEAQFATWGNTYFDHPISWPQFSTFPLDSVSVDFWAPFFGPDGISGRDNPIDFDVGYAIVDFVWFDPNPPWIRWYIWQGEIFIIPWEWVGYRKLFAAALRGPIRSFRRRTRKSRALHVLVKDKQGGSTRENEGV